jgi:hypothetical protein
MSHAPRQLPSWLISDVRQASSIRSPMAKKKNKDYRVELYFVRGKMKRRKVSLFDGMEVDEFVLRNADDVFLLENAYYEILHEREVQRNASNEWLTNETERPGDVATKRSARADDDPPF